ncbi:MAG: hypothetical protein ACTSU2_16120 [Promethearchaeota archaeon]
MRLEDSQLFWNSIFTLTILTIAVLLIYISSLSYKHKNKYGAWSTLISGLIILCFAIANQFNPIIVWPFNGILDYWIFIVLGFNFIYAISIYLNDTFRKGNSPNTLNKSHTGQYENENKVSPSRENTQNTSGGMDKDAKNNNIIIDKTDKDYLLYRDEFTFKKELYRKAFHLFGLLILLCYYIVAPLVNYLLVKYILSPDGTVTYERGWGSVLLYPFLYFGNNMDSGLLYRVSVEITYFAFWAAIIFIAVPEIIRILIGAKYSFYNKVTNIALRKKEYKSAGPQLFIVVGSIVAFSLAKYNVLNGPALLGILSVSFFSDALAAIIGRRYGVHKIKVHNNEQKSIEGFLAGGISAFIFAVIFMGPFYALICALVFFLIDFYPIKVADNILNPILISFSVTITYFLTGIPIGR